ncbi:hypothetical protein [Bifidobacterium crudilactis]|nr:hypothetical protein [Bifidobacterium crudilactis]MDN6559506.1 hypothetical protein [Bifidobacterium crudilactis]MDN6772470.1 hypothetical protein [Bifidobacterium crudilactis]MDN6815285.1 hypothetical protein [Bifidobacterium crudilactis]
MGLPEGWVTDPQHSQLTNSQQITALGNGVLPLQAVRAIDSFRGESGQISPDIRSAWKPCNLSNADM